MFGSAKYRYYRYGADDHVAVVHTEMLPIKAAIFVTSAIHKAAHTGEFNYGRNFYAKDADALNVTKLPSFHFGTRANFFYTSRRFSFNFSLSFLVLLLLIE